MMMDTEPQEVKRLRTKYHQARENHRDAADALRNACWRNGITTLNIPSPEYFDAPTMPDKIILTTLEHHRQR